MAGLGAGLLGDLGGTARQVAKPKKKSKKRPVPKAFRQEAPASQKKAEVHLGAGALGGVAAASRQVAKPQQKRVSTPGDAKKLALAESALKELRKPRSKIAGLQGHASPVPQLPAIADLVAGRATTFGSERNAARATIDDISTVINAKFGDKPDPRLLDKGKVVRTGGGLPLAALKVAGITPTLAALYGAAKGISQAPGIVGRAGADAIAFPKQAVLGIYGIGHAGVRAAQGDTDEAEALAKALTQGAAGRLVQGDVKGSLKVFNEHPLFGALDFAGLESLLGRGAGALSRTAGTATAAKLTGGALGPESRLGRVGALERPDLKIADTGQIVQGRRYSKDLIVKGGQVALERRRAAQGRDPHMASERRTNRELKRQLDENIGQAEAVRRVDRGQAHNDTAKLEERGLTRRSRKHDEVVAAVLEGGIRKPASVFLKDVGDELARLKAVKHDDLQHLGPEAIRNNKRQVAALEELKAMTPEKLEAARVRIVSKAELAAPHLDRVEGELLGARALEKNQALAARVRTYAVKRMGLRYDHTKSAPEHLERRYSEAKAAEGKANATLKTVRSELQRERLRASGAGAVAKSQRAKEPGHAVYKVGDEEFATRKAAVEKHGNDAQIERVATTKREAERVGMLGKHDRNIKALTEMEKNARKKVTEARAYRKKVDPKKYATGLVDRDGRRVSTDEILEHIANDPHAHMPSYLPHLVSQSGGRAHFVNFFGSGRKQVDTRGVRTGSAALKGAQDASVRAVSDAIVGGQGKVSAIRAHDRFIRDLGKKGEDGKVKLQTQAAAHREAMESYYPVGHPKAGQLIPGKVEWTVTQAIPTKIKGERVGEIAELQGARIETSTVLQDALKPAKGKAAERPTFALVPQKQVWRAMEHQSRGSSEIGKFVKAYTGMFRGTVLPFSVKWLVGNSVEAALRLAIQDTPAGLVQSRRAGKQVLAALEKHDERAWKDFEARTLGGLQVGGQHQIYRGAERWEGTMAEGLAKRAAVLRQTPIVRILPNRIGAYQKRVFQFNSWIERNTQIVALGKEARREIQATTGSWAKATTLQRAAVEDVAKGLVNTPNQIRFARAVDDTLGKYNRHSPNIRATIQTSAPFLPWYLNSVKFIYHTLPAKHPIKTAVLASAERALQGEFDKTHTDAFEDLKGAIRTGDGGFMDLARYTPFGVVTEGGTSATGIFLPQFQSLLFTAYGLDFAGRKIKTQDGEEVHAGSTKAVLLALNAAAESVLPGLSVARRLQEQGESSYGDSTIWAPRSREGTDYGQDLPGPLGSGRGVTKALNRITNPVRTTYLHGGPSNAGGADGGGDVVPVGDAGSIWASPSGASAGAVQARPSAAPQDESIWARP